MKNTILIVSFIASMMNMAHAASNGTITYSGKIIDQTCSVVLNNGSSATGTVNLPAVAVDRLTSIGKTAGKTGFTLNISGCKASSNAFGVTAYFPGSKGSTYISNYYNSLTNQETGANAATGVGIQLLSIDGTTETVVPLGEPITNASYKYVTVAANATTATLRYAAQYIVPWSTSANPGLVKGIAIYELAYK